MMFSATTMDPAEYVRLIDWCYDAGGLGLFVSGWEAGGLYHASVTVPGDDVRLEAFEKWFDGRAGWNVSTESGRKTVISN